MTDKEKVRTELKEKLEELDYSSSLRLTLVRAIEYIDSIPEKHVSEDLEEAAIMHYKDVMEYEAKTGLKPAYMTSFKAGAKWQANQGVLEEI